MRVRHWNTSVDGPLSETAMRRKLESAGYLVARHVYPPGTTFPEHSHRLRPFLEEKRCPRSMESLA